MHTYTFETKDSEILDTRPIEILANKHNLEFTKTPTPEGNNFSITSNDEVRIENFKQELVTVISNKE